MQRLTSQEAMNINAVRVKTTAHLTQGAGGIGLRPAAQRDTEIVYSKSTIVLVSAVARESSVKHTQSHTLSPAHKGHIISISIRTVSSLSLSHIATHQTCLRWHLTVCAHVLLCRPICAGSKVMAGPGRGYR